jgi:membrane-associated phospholipid phosphatase
MPITALDRLVDFSAQAIWLYASLWVYVNLVPALIDDRREMLSYYLSAAAICAVGFSIFFFWPTTTPAADIDWARYPFYQPLKTADRGGNAMPSLHACFAIFSALWIDRLLRTMHTHAAWRVFNGLWCVGIFYSTLATKQHVAIDVYAGLLLGLAGYALQIAIARWLRKPAALAASTTISS